MNNKWIHKNWNEIEIEMEKKMVTLLENETIYKEKKKKKEREWAQHDSDWLRWHCGIDVQCT